MLYAGHCSQTHEFGRARKTLAPNFPVQFNYDQPRFGFHVQKYI
jgi:hypothetical protein